jgi:hypothetical protein
MFDTLNAQGAPFRQAGKNALSDISVGFGGPNAAADQWASTYYLPQIQQHMADIGQPLDPNWTPDQATLDQWSKFAPSDVSSTVPAGYFSHQFNADDLKTNLAPNYDFMLSQGLGAAKNAGNLQTGLLSGNTLKGVTDYAENYAGNAYQNAFANYTSNQNNIFNRLATIAGFGTSANQTTASAGSSLAGNEANTIMGAGAAGAAGTVGQANAISGGLNNAASWYALPSLLKAGQQPGDGPG